MVTSIYLSSIQIFWVNLNKAAGSGTEDKVRAMLGVLTKYRNSDRRYDIMKEKA